MSERENEKREREYDERECDERARKRENVMRTRESERM